METLFISLCTVVEQVSKYITTPSEIIDKNTFWLHNIHIIHVVCVVRSDKYSALHRIAEQQQGLFTTRQAVGAGFDARNHAYYLKKGYWKREYRGIYRLKHFPFETYAEYALWSLWSCNRNGEPQGVYSYETALEFYKLSDLSPAKIAMIVPPSFRRSAKIPDVLTLHRAKLNPSDWNMVEGFRVTTPVRTLRDIVFSKHISDEFIHQAVRDGLSRGMYPKHELRRYGILGLVENFR